MYHISDIVLIQLALIFIVYNTPFLQKYVKRVKQSLTFCADIFYDLCDNNPLILDYSYNDAVLDDKPMLNPDIQPVQIPVPTKYEDKYLEKFKKFPNEFQFTRTELDEQELEYNKIKTKMEDEYTSQLTDIRLKLSKVISIQESINNIDYSNNTVPTKDGLNKILDYYDLREEYDEDPESVSLKELYDDIYTERTNIQKELDELESGRLYDDDYRKMAKEAIINRKLDNFINNYVMEHTPLGNVYMRYNNDKKSFEYFSNHTIPYRYLEPIGRKYVTTYHCKPIFVDIEEELKNAEVRYELDKKKEEEQKDQKEKNNKNVLAKLKSYNKDSKVQLTRPMKNRGMNDVLPPQMQAMLPDVNKPSEKQLLKEHSNRYTWEGRLADFCPLKKIDKKVVDKNLNLNYADYKKMQQQQNKK